MVVVSPPSSYRSYRLPAAAVALLTAAAMPAAATARSLRASASASASAAGFFSLPPSVRRVGGGGVGSVVAAPRRAAAAAASSALAGWGRGARSGFVPLRPAAPLLLSSPSSSPSSSSSANADLVAARIEVAAAKRAARRRSLEEDRERNLKLRRMLSTESSVDGIEGEGEGGGGNSTSPTGYVVPPMYQVRVSVCRDLRGELRMNGRERRGRVFLEVGSDGTKTLKGLKCELHAFFRALRKSTYVLSAALPEFADDGSILPPPESESDPESDSAHPNLFWPIDDDDDVVRTFALADERFNNSTAAGGNAPGRPSVLLRVSRDPSAPCPPPPPPYLEGMPDPSDSTTLTMISFYSFPPGGIPDPEDLASRLRRLWSPFGALGRVYVAGEGVNAQMAVPTDVMDRFADCCASVGELGDHVENGINVDPVPLTREEFDRAGDMDGKPAPPFRNLHVRVRSQVVADGLEGPLDWQSAGYDMPPLEWHARLKEARERRRRAGGTATDDDDAEGGEGEEIPLILDCRNTYETAVGGFVGSEPLGTETFRESWDALRDRLRDTPRDAPIMTYCTGGIRCVKVGAYLTQELGFRNVSRLAGGIVAYDRALVDGGRGDETMFRGTNFVFDGRVGRRITGDDVGECATCGGRAGLVGNCANGNCHVRMVQCEACRAAFLGACSDACRRRVVMQRERPAGGAVAAEGPSPESEGDVDVDRGGGRGEYRSLDEYSEAHSSPAPPLRGEIELNTMRLLPAGAHMVSGPAQGRLLAQLASMGGGGRALEIGTFTGYGTACLLEGCANAAGAAAAGRGGPPVPGGGGAGGGGGGPYVLTLERDGAAADLAAAHLDIMSRFGVGERGAEEARGLRGGDGGGVGVVEGSARGSVSFEYNGAGCEILRVTDALATVEEMARGEGPDPPAPFDLVYVDADKTRLLDYVEACAGSDRLLRGGGLILVDNVLWKGLVLDAAGGWSRGGINVRQGDGMGERELKKNRRARKLAGVMHRFNEAIAGDDRVEVVLLPLRDGLSIIRKR